MTILAVIVVLVVTCCVAWILAAALGRRSDPLLRIARARADHAVQLRLFQERSRIRAAETEEEAKKAMNAIRGYP